MKTSLLKPFLLLSFLFLIQSCASDRNVPKAQNILFKNVAVISMVDEHILENKSVYIADGKIIAIDDYENLKLPKKTLIINAEDKFLLPGFSDMHVHLNSEEDLALYLANGVTTIRNMRGDSDHLVLKEAISNKEILGPNLFTTGPIVDSSIPVLRNSLILDNPADVEQAIKQMKIDGYDFIKVYYRIKIDVYHEIIRVAKEINIPVVGHVPNLVGIDAVLESGQQSIEHFTGYSQFMSEEKSSEILEMTVKSKIWNCPTLIVKKNYENLIDLKSSEIGELKYVHSDIKNYWKGYSSFNMEFDYAQKLLKKLNDKSANIVSGTDTGNPYVIAGFSLHEEFQLMQESGLTPFQVLLTTTVKPAEMLGTEEYAGTIKVGKNADLVLLNKNPLIDIQNTRAIEGVMTKGIWLSKIKIQEMLDEVESTYRMSE